MESVEMKKKYRFNYSPFKYSTTNISMFLDRLKKFQNQNLNGIYGFLFAIEWWNGWME